MRAGRAANRLAAVALAISAIGLAGAAGTQGATWHLLRSFGRGGVAGLPLRERRQEAPSQGAPPLPERYRSLVVPGPAGTLYVGGYATSRRGAFLLARMSAAGTLVKGFGHGGVSTVPTIYWFTQDPPRMLALPGGKVLVVGLDHGDQLVAVRMTASGKPDGSFGHDGVVRYALAHAHGFTIVTAAALQPDGDILAVYQHELPQPANQPRVPEGQGNGVVEYVRLSPSGALDRSFGEDGFLAAPAKELTFLEGESGTIGACQETLAASGSLLSAYESDALEELTPAGEPLAGFGEDPAVPAGPGPPYETRNRDHFCNALLALGNGEIEGASGRVLERLTASGLPDPAFASAGAVTLAAGVQAAAIGAGGETFTAGNAGGQLLISGVLANGHQDSALGGAGGQRFAVSLPHALAEHAPSWELLPGGSSLTIRIGEELVRVAR